MIAIDLSYIACMMLTYIPSSLLSLELFHEVILDFVKDLLCIYWDGHVISNFECIYMVDCFYWLVYIELSLHL